MLGSDKWKDKINTFVDQLISKQEHSSWAFAVSGRTFRVQLIIQRQCIDWPYVHLTAQRQLGIANRHRWLTVIRFVSPVNGHLAADWMACVLQFCIKTPSTQRVFCVRRSRAGSNSLSVNWMDELKIKPINAAVNFTELATMRWMMEFFCRCYNPQAVSVEMIVYMHFTNRCPTTRTIACVRVWSE